MACMLSHELHAFPLLSPQTEEINALSAQGRRNQCIVGAQSPAALALMLLVVYRLGGTALQLNLLLCRCKLAC